MSANVYAGQPFMVGLGNPGAEYAQTRHNAGAMLLSHLQKKWQLNEFQFDKYSNALITRGSREKGLGGSEKETTTKISSLYYPLVLAFPQTFMNESGKSVAFIMEKEKFAPDQLLVLHDDKDIPFGEIKLQKDISSAGHKGVQSIIDTLSSNGFWRLRIGIGPVPEPLTTEMFVLQKFTAQELEDLTVIFDQLFRDSS